MTIPGVDLYAIASSVIGVSEYTYYAFSTRTLDDRGIFIPSFAEGVSRSASIQAVPRKAYTSLGLDLSKYYIKIFSGDEIKPIDRLTSGDQLEFNSDRYQVLDQTDWNPIGSWSSVVAVKLIAEQSI